MASLAPWAPKMIYFHPCSAFFLGSTLNKKMHLFWSSIASRAICRKNEYWGGGRRPVLYFTIQAKEKYSTSDKSKKSPTDSENFLKCYIPRVKMMRKDRLRRNICFPLCWSSPRSNYVPPVKTQHKSTLVCNISLLLGNKLVYNIYIVIVYNISLLFGN